ncbi:hypothetical protein O181_030206 [Austropuccinia psidii MF-1]|uniref:Retrotransposon gag domain-containing protein n=1 Tax=Austropuccinia psidii MF-1 TaxID=1389203 RepID=A0A9Q3CY06_9BASI|nr:hypothetical protein [Austropuccinia psidii MF-1]
MEDARVSPHSPRPVPTKLDVNSEPELIEGDILMDEPFPSGRNRNISVPIQNLVQRSKRIGVGNMPKPLAGGHELLLTHQQLSESGEDHKSLRRVEPTVLQRQGKNSISRKDIPKLEECPTFSGEGEYKDIEFIRTMDMLQEYFNIPYDLIVGKLHSLFTRTANKWYYKIRQDHGRHDCPWWKSEVITKWANDSWRFKMENAFESVIFNSEKDEPLPWFLKQKDRLSSLHPDMSDSIININILIKV